MTFDIILELPFDSARERMSVIIKISPDSEKDQYFIITKGADSSMVPLLIMESGEFISKIKSDLYRYSCEGLRTLVFGKKELSKVKNIIFRKMFKAYYQFSLKYQHHILKIKMKN